ncbi:MAG: DUF6089 family protein [Ferruginibacter sp.]
MKVYFFAFLLFIGSACNAQKWFAEVMAGAASYNGDLTQKEVSIKRIYPSASFNLKYNTGDFLNFRLGLSYAKLGASDHNNPDSGLQSRNLSFKTNIIELNFCTELNVLDPETYYAYPYIFAGVGVFHFNPYTNDNDGNKTFLQPLGTEGQGMVGKRKKYSLYQACFPVGAGGKLNLNHDMEIGFEFGYRILVTDYLDDVSKTYVNLKGLQEANGNKAVELSYRKKSRFIEEGEKRGNSARRDNFWFAGIKLAIQIAGPRKDRD